MGITYRKDTAKITVLLQAKMKELRYFEEGNFFDTILMQIDPSGDVEKAVSFSNEATSYDMFSAN